MRIGERMDVWIGNRISERIDSAIGERINGLDR